MDSSTKKTDCIKLAQLHITWGKVSFTKIKMKLLVNLLLFFYWIDHPKDDSMMYDREDDKFILSYLLKIMCMISYWSILIL
jgi:hypothetical protein